MANATCAIDCNASEIYQRNLKRLRKSYAHVDEDLKNSFEEISRNWRTAQHATPVPGIGVGPPGTGEPRGPSVWKYRIASRDRRTGSSNGYRVVAYHHAANNTLYPFCIYTHDDYEKQPPQKDLARWANEVIETLAANTD